eukprot:NODE_3004_length_716_cov_495.077961_g2121_i0.p1 GENE.NODE_3004_length_716_cov_495.077961_g2121_i0~~NODE_3004_length_716_cov_495.077961_g2121_i0.p1  ORF type:complete len:143 (+),score=43.09 NODE_3004_length_716_cov_495.077961_g2121_i0:75-503(+)
MSSVIPWGGNAYNMNGFGPSSVTNSFAGFGGYQIQSVPTYTMAPPPQPPVTDTKLSVTPDRVEKLLELAYTKLENLGTQLRAAAQELEEIRAEILTANNLCDSELRSQLQSANDEIYKLRNQLTEAAERKANKMDKKDLLNM